MNSHENISEELLARYLAGTASEDDIFVINSWLSQSPENERVLSTYQDIWELSNFTQKNKKVVDTDAAWNQLRKKMTYRENVADDNVYHHPAGKSVVKSNRKWPWAILAAAAMVLVVLTYGKLFLHTDKELPAYAETKTNQNTIEKILPDGTKVFLNYNSSLSYPQEFTGDLRKVSLEGEAFFDVKPDAKHPFVIDADGTEIKVLGTSFNVKANSVEPVRVDVFTGKVMIRKKEQEIFLIRGESAEVANDTIRSISQNLNLLGYRTQVFDFKASTLNEVVSSMRSGYHIDLRLANTQLAQCRLTIRFEKEPVDATLSVIAETLQLKIRKEGETYWLDGHGCQ